MADFALNLVFIDGKPHVQIDVPIPIPGTGETVPLGVQVPLSFQQAADWAAKLFRHTVAEDK